MGHVRLRAAITFRLMVSFFSNSIEMEVWIIHTDVNLALVDEWLTYLNEHMSCLLVPENRINTRPAEWMKVQQIIHDYYRGNGWMEISVALSLIGYNFQVPKYDKLFCWNLEIKKASSIINFPRKSVWIRHRNTTACSLCYFLFAAYKPNS